MLGYSNAVVRSLIMIQL